MGLNFWLVAQAIGGGIIVVVLVQMTIERFAARLAVEDIQTTTTLASFASISACTIIHLHYLGPKPLPNLIIVPVLVPICLLCFLLMTYLPHNHGALPPHPDAAVKLGTLKDYIQSSVGWAIRTALAAIFVAVLRSGSLI